jgi:hypothetical protein
LFFFCGHLKDRRAVISLLRFLLGPGSRSSSTSSLSSIASGAPPTPTSPRRRLASEGLDTSTKTPLRDQQQANNQANNNSTNSSSSSVANRLQPLRKNALPGETQAASSFCPSLADVEGNRDLRLAMCFSLLLFCSGLM